MKKKLKEKYFESMYNYVQINIVLYLILYRIDNLDYLCEIFSKFIENLTEFKMF